MEFRHDPSDRHSSASWPGLMLLSMDQIKMGPSLRWGDGRKRNAGTRWLVGLAGVLMLCACATTMQATSPDASHADESTPHAAPQDQHDEVFYHVFNRSFRDSDGDGHGDLQGVIDGLDYLQSLGVTSILLTPLYPSEFYHNYFTSDFEGIDPEFGTADDYRRLIAEVHRRGMKLYLDQEIQYTDGEHPWFKESLNNPDSRYGDFILYKDAGNREPGTAVFGTTVIGGFGAENVRLTTVNLKSPGVQAYFRRLFLHWIDPDGDGDFSDGVDGFRIDHMMDTLDDKPRLDNLFAEFWRPLFDEVRAANPKVTFIAEQADWGDGRDFLVRGDTDYVFAFPLRAAIRSFDKDRIITAIAQTAAATPPGKHQLLFVENHDMARLASDPGMTPEKLRTAAVLDVLLAGTPILYYGQELGMRGALRDEYRTDEKDIGNREAFEWNAKVESKPHALWYRGPGSYWTQRFARDDDGISVVEQDGDPDSLLNFYRRLFALRRGHAALRMGAQAIVDSAPGLLIVERANGEERLRIVANLGGQPVTYRPADSGASGVAIDLLGRARSDAGSVHLAPYQTAVLTVRTDDNPL
jgi:alpha-amylase